MTDPSYEERYCAFVDILGFHTVIQGLRDGTTAPDRIKRVLQQIHDPVEGRRKEYASSDFRALSISDAVALSTKVSGVGLGHLLFVLRELALGLLFEGGFFIRGAIVKGKLYHDSTSVFGEALVEAYRLESKVARYPRIMVVRDVVQDASVYWGNDERMRPSEDGPTYVHVLRPLARDAEIAIRRDADVDAEECAQLNYYVQIARQIQKKLGASVDDPRIFEKVRWFARYWNDIVSERPVKGTSANDPGNLHLSAVLATKREIRRWR